MRHLLSMLAIGCILLSPVGPAFAQTQDDVARLEKQRCPRPKELALVFSFGYAGDHMPKDDAAFAELLTLIKKGGFNVVHCTYTDKRLELCQKAGIKMMVDLLAEEHHVYKSPDKAKAVCEKLRNHPDVWGYNIWNDPMGKSGPGRRRDINSVRAWDPTHPAYCGTYRTIGMNHLVNADVLGYYDFHWKRGPQYHFPHLLSYWKWARERDAWYYSWLSCESGNAGKGNFNRSLYSANTALACGQRGILWFLATDLMNRKTFEWTLAGNDIIKVNLAVLPLAKEMPTLGLPSAIYSTPITRTMNNDPVDKKDMMPAGLENHRFPKDFWAQPVEGEFVLGVYSDAEKRDAIFLANHNAYAESKVALKVDRPAAQWFNRQTTAWQPLEVRDGVVRLTLEPGGGELVRFK